MEQREIIAEQRKGAGKCQARAIRKTGWVPAIAYGRGEHISLQVPKMEFENILKAKAGSNVIINLKFKDNKELDRHVFVKEIQKHPFKQILFHIDFENISLKEKINVKIPIEAKGDAIGVKEGGMLEHHLWEIEVQCLPMEIPDCVKIDVTNLKIGDVVYVKDLNVPENITVVHNQEDVVFTLVAPKEEKAVDATAEEKKEPEVLKQKKEVEGAEASGSEKDKKEKK